MNVKKGKVMSVKSLKTRIMFNAYEGEEPYLFISYSHVDTDAVYRILNRLDEEKFRIWFDDTMEVGEDFREELRIKIEKCSAFVLFVSKASMESKYCGMEIITAYKNNKKIYPIYVEDGVEIPSALKLMLENLQHVNGVSTDAEDKYISKLVEGLPIEAMRSLVVKNGVLEKCKDGSKVVNIPESVFAVGESAFKECEKLEEVNISYSATTLRDEAFRGCKSIRVMHLPINIQHVGDSAFRDCISMRELKIDNGDIEIGERAFENCRELTSVTLPENLTEIYGGVFNSCRGLKTIHLPDELMILGESAFAGCISLEAIEIPEKVSKIDDMAFSGCISLKSLSLKNGLGKIGKNAFKDCKSLSEVNIPQSVYMMGTSPFRGCDGLMSITVDEKSKHFKALDDILFNKNKSTLICYPAEKDKYEYEVPDSVTIISDWAFCGCSKLSKITIPDSVYEIGEGAFYKCIGLKYLELPDSVERIDDTAFRGCSNLEVIVIPSSVKEFGWGLLNGCDNVTVICDDESEAANYCDKKKIKHQESID